MTKNQNKQNNSNQRCALIYNPHAGIKRRLLPNPTTTNLEDIQHLLEKYQIITDHFPTIYSGHARKLATKLSQKYNTILVAGGDGTVGETANGLIGTNTTLGILPLGSYMNVARMLSIPLDIEKAILLIKLGRSRKIDVGMVTKLNGEILKNPYYFLESAGIGLEAQLHENATSLEKGDLTIIWKVAQTLFDYYDYPTKIFMDGKEIRTKATVIAVSNGPYTGAAIPLAPSAKLNDHKLTVTIFKMPKWEVLKYLFMSRGKYKRKYSRKIETYQAKDVRIETKVKRLVHADARHFGETPVEFSILPNALNIISGFPEKGTSTLIKRTYLDP